MSCADVARVAGQVEQLAAVAEADLDLVDARRRGREPVVDPALVQLRADAGQCPAQLRVLAERRVPVDDRERVRAEVLLAGELKLAPSPSRTRLVPHHRLWPSAPLPRPRDGDLLLEDSCVGVVAERDQGAGDQAAARRRPFASAGRSAQRARRLPERGRRPESGQRARATGRTCHRPAGSSRGSTQLGPSGSRSADGRRHAHAVSTTTPALRRLVAERACDHAVLGDLEEGRPRPQAATVALARRHPSRAYGSMSAKRAAAGRCTA